VAELERHEFFRPPEKRETMQVNLRNIFLRMSPSEQDIQTLHGIVRTLAEGSKGPATGGILRGGEAELLRGLLAKDGAGGNGGTAPGKGLARLLRRNPTAAERALWQLLISDRRFAGQFKRNVPIGPQVADFLAQPLRLVLDLVPDDEDEAASNARAAKRAWLEARRYRVLEISASDAVQSLALTAERVADAMRAPAATKS
jgi:tRNA/rRNA methyltransferase